MKRDASGKVLAGLYFGLKPFDRGFFSLFYQDENQKQIDFKISFSDVYNERDLSEATLENLLHCQTQLELRDGLIELLKKISLALNNAEFMQQLLTINQRIVILAENN